MKWPSLVVFALSLTSCGGSGTAKNSKAEDSTSMQNYAYVISTNFVKDYLKSPSSADFDYFTASPTISLTNGIYTVNYHFDADNSFGAKIRSQYTCDLRYLGGKPESKSSWELRALQIDGNTVAGSFSIESHAVESNSTKASALSGLYHIEKTDGNGYYLKVYVYLKDKQRLTEVNDEVSKNYEGKYSVTLSIWYFDKKGFVDQYLASIDNPNISDDKFNALDRHLIATFDKKAGEDGDMEMNH